MGINIGAFICNFVAAYLRNHYTWGWAFSAAGFGMVLGLIWFATGLKHVRYADVINRLQKEDMPISKIAYVCFCAGHNCRNYWMVYSWKYFRF